MAGTESANEDLTPHETTQSTAPAQAARLRPAWLRIGIRAISLLIFLLIVATLGISCAQRQIIFPGQSITDFGPTPKNIDASWIGDEANQVEMWFLPGDRVSADHPGPAVIYAHGNYELIDSQPAWLSAYQRMGISVVLCEFRGYGRSAGSPSEEAITADFVACYDRVAARPEVDPARIFFHGRSLGGGVACALASQRKPRAIILQSAFTSITDIAAEMGVPSFLIFDPFDNVTALEKYDGPVLLLHGTNDTVIPFAHAEQLHKAAKHSQLIPFTCGHNDWPLSSDQLWQPIRTFLTQQQIISH